MQDLWLWTVAYHLPPGGSMVLLATSWIGVWLGPKAILGSVGKRIILAFPRMHRNIFGQKVIIDQYDTSLHFIYNFF
jgi:hypothetical protein